MLNNQSRRNPVSNEIPDPSLSEEEELNFTCPDCGSYISENREVCEDCLNEWAE